MTLPLRTHGRRAAASIAALTAPSSVAPQRGTAPSSHISPTHTEAHTTASASDRGTHTRSAIQETASVAGTAYNFSSSKIVRTAIAAGIIVIAICALILFFKISSWVRYRQRLRRETALTSLLEAEEQARAFELAAWSDSPGQAPVYTEPPPRRRRWFGLIRRRPKGTLRRAAPSNLPGGITVPPKDEKGKRRGGRAGVNAYGIFEWEGKAA